MKASKRKACRIILAAAIAIALAAGFCLRGQSLVLTDSAGRSLLRRTVGIGDRFSIVFTHSLARSRVEEVFEVTRADEFRLRETVYADFGAGLPHEETAEQRMAFADGRIRRTGYDMPFRDLWLRVGHIADHRLEFTAEDSLRLAELDRPGAAVRLAVVPNARWFWQRGIARFRSQ
ncbi:MAG: DUF1850 domain-containing protein [Planctomycetes bacterium]|nr:DUF1850 domain-containing protein [Planctomycetota bacterium]